MPNYKWKRIVLIKKILLFALMVSGTSFAQVRVAVGNFENASDVIFLDSWSRMLPQLLQSELTRYAGLTLLERQKLKDVLKEHQLLLSGLVEDSAQVEALGKLAGADILLTGTVNKIDGFYRIDVNIIRVAAATVRVEKAEASDKKHLQTMVHLLANNIAYRMTGNNKYTDSIKLQQYPTYYFAGAGALFAGLTLLAHSSYATNLDKYHNTRRPDKFDTYYNKADSAYKLEYWMGGLTAAALSGILFCWIKNRSGLEVRAGSVEGSRVKTALNFYPHREMRLSVQIRF